MYRKKYKGKNHKVIKTSKVIEKEVFVAKKKKGKARLTGKLLFFIVGIFLIGIGFYYYKNQELTNKGIKEVTNEGIKELTNEGVKELRNKGIKELTNEEKEIEINPVQAAVLKDELFKINFNLKNNDFGGGDMKINYDPINLEFKKIDFGETSFDSSKFIKNVGEIEINEEKILGDNFDLFFESINEGMTRIKIKFGNIEKEVLINVLKVEAENPQIVCSQTILESPYITDFISGPELGTVTLYWIGKNMGSKIKVYYGQESGKYNFGDSYVEDNGEFVIKNLKPGESYYFVLQRYDNCNNSSLSQEVFVKAGYGVLTKTNVKEDLDLPVSYELIP